MSWRDQLRPGSFRGAAFLIKHHDLQVGRRIALHQYPLRDTPWAEDLGRRAREFSIECFVLGPNYMAARDALIAALEKKGPGTLVHPYYGTRQVVVAGPARISESSTDGGMCRLSIPFAEAGVKKEPASTTDTASALSGSATSAQATLANSFSTKFSVSSMPQWVKDSTMADQASLLDTLRSYATQITTLPQELQTWLNQAAEYSSGLSQLVLSPAGLANELIALISGLQTIAAQPIAAVNVYGNLLSWVPDTTPTSGMTPQRVQQSSNRTALVNLVQGAAVTSGAASISSVPAQSTTTLQGFDSRDKALAVRDQFTAAIEEQQLTVSSSAYAALSDLRVSLVRDISERAAALPRLVNFTPMVTLPAVVIANRLYEDPTRDAEIVQRNAMTYPGFATGGNALEVLDA